MLNQEQATFQTPADEQALCDLTSELLSEKKVVAWFQGAMEFGPRSLGNRSILADPREQGMHARLNATVKNRESFRPFAPAVLAERAAELFEIKSGESLPYMLFAVPCNSPSMLPVVAHVDQSARLQTVDRNRNPLFHRLLRKFDQTTGCPVLVNTSFNVRGEPIVCSPVDAYRCYVNTDIDAMVIGRHVLQKPDHSAATQTSSKKSVKHGRPSWLNLEVPWDPTQRMLRHFALSFLISLPLMAMILGFSWKYVALAFAMATLLGACSALFPRLGLVIYRTLLIGALPIVLILSECMLALIYYLVVTLIGLLLRSFRYRGLSLQFDQKATTYWSETISRRDVRHYYQQS